MLLGAQNCQSRKIKMTRLDRSLIASLSAFEGLTPAELDRMVGQARSLRIARNRAVFEQEGDAHSFFLLLDGHIRVVKSTAEGGEVTVRYIGPGELMGIATALGRITYPASAIAAVDCVVLAWASSLWSEFASAYPSFGASTYKTVGNRLQDAHTRVVVMSSELVDR
jgi:CRP-like cAMP-binding protein